MAAIVFWLSNHRATTKDTFRISHGGLISLFIMVKNVIWKERLKISQDAVKMMKQVTEVEKTKRRTIFGKTGTGCIDKNCMNKPGRQLGWFVGILRNENQSYVFAINFSSLGAVMGYAGPNAKKLVTQFFDKFYPG